MAHTVKEKAKLLARVRRIKGQAEAVERALEPNSLRRRLMLVASMRGAINGLTAELMEDQHPSPRREPGRGTGRERAGAPPS